MHWQQASSLCEKCTSNPNLSTPCLHVMYADKPPPGPKVDEDKGGSISPQELGSLMETLGLKPNQVHCVHMNPTALHNTTPPKHDLQPGQTKACRMRSGETGSVCLLPVFLTGTKLCPPPCKWLFCCRKKTSMAHSATMETKLCSFGLTISPRRTPACNNIPVRDMLTVTFD